MTTRWRQTQPVRTTIMSGRRHWRRLQKRRDANDRAAGVSLQLVPTTDAEVAGHGQEPARDPLGVGAGVPNVLDCTVIAAAEHARTPRTGVEAGRADSTVDGIDPFDDVDHGALIGSLSFGECNRRSRRPRASPVGSASSGGVQNRRNRPSHSSTS